MRSNVAFAGSVLFAFAVATACNCGWIRGSGQPCDATTPCPPNETCAEGVCRFVEELPDGGLPGDGGTGPGSDGGTDGGCVGLQCNQVNCPKDSPTRLTGTVRDPAGLNPVYNALVYIPTRPPEAFTDGVTCDVCNPATGSPLVLTTSKTDGTFQLDNVPATDGFPLVIQVGKWRRQVTIPTAAPCRTTPVAADLTRLPKNKSEGDIPRIAISTGNVDPFECLLLRMGIDASEFTGPTGTGRIHWYNRNGTNLTGQGSHANLIGSLDTLKKYDVVILPCTGNTVPGPSTDPSSYTSQQRNIINYTSAGGRLFATHFSYEYVGTFGLQTSSTTMVPVANWRYQQPVPTTNGQITGYNSYLIDTTFPKGQAFQDWLRNQNALDAGSTMWIFEPRHDVDSVNPQFAQRWMYGNNPNVAPEDAPHVEHFTFNTPVDAGTPPTQCGRVVFSDFHVSGDAKTSFSTFPAICKAGPLNPQEKALEFMLFDLSACVQADKPACGNVANAACSPLLPCCPGTNLTCVDSAGLNCQSPTGCTCQTILQ